MTATLTELTPPAAVSVAKNWVQQIVEQSMPASCTTIGLTNGSREGCDRRAIDALARRFQEEFAAAGRHRKLLILRLNVFAGREESLDAEQTLATPAPVASPLGAWSEVTVSVPIGRRAGAALENLPHWLPVWKREANLVIVDLGPMSEVPSRVIGRLCDSCFVLLGPGTAASREWILQHIAWHDRSGSAICGTLLVA